MNRILLWACDNMGVAVLLVAGSAIAAGVYQAGEADAIDYNLLAQTYENSTPATMAGIQDAIADGKVTRWEAQKIFQDMMLRSGGIAIRGGTLDRDQAREQLKLAVHRRHE